MNLPRNIKNAVENNDLVVFAGAGLSARFDLPNWSTLVRNVIQNLEKNELKSFLELLDNNLMTPLEVLDKIQSHHSEVKKYITQNFSINKGSNNLDLHKKLIEVASGQIITTNFDNAFEVACGDSINPAIPTSTYNVSGVNKGGNPYIFKIHGCYKEPDNCTIFNEDYEKLYSQDNATVERLKSIFAEKTILFLGFSFSDADLNNLFNHLNNLYQNNNKHFIVTTKPKDFANFDFLETIEIENHEQLDEVVHSLLECKKADNKDLDDSIEVSNERTPSKIAILHPNPLDVRVQSELLKLVSCFENLEAHIFHGFLNMKTLSQIEDFDLLIIASKVFKSKIYIEEDNLKSSLCSLNEVFDNIPNDNLPIVFITNEEISDVNQRDAIYISTIKPQIINRFIFKALRNNELSFKEKEIKVHLDRLLTRKINKGIGKSTSIYGNDRSLSMGKKCLNSVIGRIEEQSIIASKLLSISNSNKLLNIKASGGIGKTTLIKKVAYELYNRGYYTGGVEFISCETVKSYDDFEEILIEGFNLTNILNFKEHLEENIGINKLDTLIILDNFETVANSLEQDEFERVISLLKFSTDYTNIVVTSREKISNKEDFEDVYSLTPLITDDAVQVFEKFYGPVKSNSELKILREDILEDLLNNNPLAIKLVITSRTKFRHIEELKIQLQNNFFESTNEDYSLVFSNKADLNIERTKSIYQSINYSYDTLLTNEKLAFELLHLFPDGISLSNFKKCFKKRSSSNQLTDKDLRVLKDKSLVEDYNGTLQLQPIIRRFAKYQFSKRSLEIRKKYCLDAYTFNCFILDIIELIVKKKSYSEAMRLYSHYKNNLLNVLNYIPDIERSKNGKVKDKKYFLNYIYDLDGYIANKKQINEFENCLDDLADYFSDVENAQILIKTLKHNQSYFHKEFDKSYNELSKLLPVEDLSLRTLENEDYIEKRYKDLISNIHSMEGHTIELLTYHINNWDFSRFLDYHFFYLGILDNISRKKEGFYYFEYDLMFDKLNVDELEEYIDSLYMDEHLEAMQCTYTLSKVKKLDKKRIQKLVVTNPYTQGLKYLMFAFEASSYDLKKEYFCKALEKLQHIKYYFLEAKYYYCKLLKDSNEEEFKVNIQDGLNLSEKFKYQYLNFLFKNLNKNENNKYLYDISFYGIDKIKDYVEVHNEQWETNFKQLEA